MATGRRTGGRPVAGGRRRRIGAAAGYRAAAAAARRCNSLGLAAAAHGDPPAGVADAGDGRDCRYGRHHQRGFRRTAGAAACRQRGAVGLCAGQLRGGPAVRGTEAAGAVAAPVAARCSSYLDDHPAAAVGRQPARAGRGGAAGRGVLRADDDRGDVAGRTTRTRIAPDRGHDLAAGRIEHRRGAGRGAVRAERRCGGVRSGFVVALVAGGGVLLLAVLARRALRPSAASTSPEGIIP